MRMFPIIIEKLEKLGFKELEGDKLDENGYYRWWEFNKNESNLSITYEFNSKHFITEAYVEFNGEQLKGRKITLLDIETLIQLM